jgi:hypothetical protein
MDDNAGINVEDLPTELPHDTIDPRGPKGK